MPRLPKPPGRRQGHGKRRTVELRAITEAPRPPDDLLRVTRDWWGEYWRSDLARATRRAQLPVVTRLAQLYDERERAFRALRRHGRLVAGSEGQAVLSPLARYVAMCDAEIRQIEDRLGLSPRALAMLTTHFVGAQKSLDELNAQLGDEDDHDDANDPRVLSIETETSQ